jgi:transposase-like protein
VDETYIRVGGQWKYLYLAVDRDGTTIDFMLHGQRDLAAAPRFLEQAISLHGLRDKVTIDKRGSNTAAVASVQMESGAAIEMRQSKCVNNIVEQDHRAIKRRVRPMMGFKPFQCARAILTGVETMHMIRNGQLDTAKVHSFSASDRFYLLAH